MHTIKLVCLTVFFIGLSYPALAQKGRGGPVGVIASPVKTEIFSDTVEALGTTRSNERVIITAETAEKVTKIYFEEGQEVKRGDLLVTLAEGEENAALKSAQAEYANARSAYNRAKALKEKRTISDAAVDERLSAMEQARAAISAASVRLDKLAITAPFDGVVGLREVSVGTLVQPSDMITTLDDIRVIKVDFDVPSIFLPTLEKGLEFIGKVEAYGDRQFTGKVQTINTRVDPVTRTVKVRGIIPNDDYALKPGLLMTITLMKNEREAMVIPEEALIKKGNKNFVYVVNDKEGKKIATQTEIKIGARRLGEIEVVSGINKDDLLINHGTIKIRNGAEIKIQSIEDNNKSIGQMLDEAPQSSIIGKGEK